MEQKKLKTQNKSHKYYTNKVSYYLHATVSKIFSFSHTLLLLFVQQQKWILAEITAAVICQPGFYIKQRSVKDLLLFKIFFTFFFYH